ncbi:MMPL family transporter [Polyangium sp. y55x31]|uniref:efflux RND transporter permease subunit n=1 Tax=Polyangium sp. y55x31 TaxID=3042688 RepID=UPI002482BD45|nr:MMPL family transporter [Polyangium sp. y55x31]MDI1474997.1 MMPL family transporter [Polyangium sp. y55x31]
MPLLVAAALTIVSVVLALRLTIQTGFESLLPSSRPSVQELHRVAARTAGVSTLFIVLEGGPNTPTSALRQAGDALVPALAAVGPPWVGSVEDGVHEARAFLAPRAGLYAETKDLEGLRDDIEARYAYEVSKATGTLLDETEEPPALDANSIKKRFKLGTEPPSTTGSAAPTTGAAPPDPLERFPDGYYQSKDGKTLVVAVRSKVIGSDFSRGSEALRRIREAVDRVNPASFHPEIRYGFGGDLQTGISEFAAINADLTEVGLFGAALLAGVVFLYYLRIRTLFAMLITIGIGVAWTFGATELLIGHLNMATGFLFTIVAGNGINFSIIYMARYLEARRDRVPLAEALDLARRETWRPTLTAAAAAGAAYGSLVATEFRGFRDFGVIGGIGMLLCWIATYLALPSILTLMERLLPLDREAKGIWGRIQRATQGGIAFGRPFAAFAQRAPRLLTVVGVAVALAGAVAAVFYVKSDPMEYDMRNLRTDASRRAEEIRLSQLGEQITGYVGTDGMAILVDRPEQVEPLRAALYAKRDAAPPGEKPFEKVHALQDFVPAAQADKIPILEELKQKVLKARRRGVISDADWKTIEELLPPDDLKPFGIEDLPAGLARAFTETDGTRGRIVYISPTEGETVDDAHYLFRWANAYRRTVLPDGSVILGSGRAVIYADMWSAVMDDIPPAVLLSLFGTILAVLLAFRRGKPSMYVLASLLVGIGWMALALVVMKVKINFLNFIALPLTFGIGVDYAVNIVQRYTREGTGGAIAAVRETGGAVVLCSMTTALGYVALVRSDNFAVRSMGVAAVIGEITCLFAAVIVLPAALVWMDRRKRA